MKSSIKLLALFAVTFLFLHSFFTVSASETSPEVTAFIEVENDAGNTVEVSLNILPHENMCISSMVFSIGYTYSYSSDNFQFSFNEENADTNLVFDERFSEATISNSHVYYDTLNYVWESSSPVSVMENELVTLATIPLDISDTALEGEYVFTLNCSGFSCYEEDTESDSGSFIDATVKLPENEVYFWLGEKLEASTSLFQIVVSGMEDIADIVSVTKNVAPEQCYISDTSIAEISDIYNFADDSGAFISIVGRKVGTTTLIIRGGYQNIEEVIVTIKVINASPYFLSISKQPAKTTYEVGEKLDLSGLELKLIYDNNDVEYVTSGFTIGSYDFSSAGSKKVEIYYGDLSVSLDVTVNTPTTSDTPTTPSTPNTPATPSTPVTPDVSPVILYGDANDDNSIDTKDLVLLRRYLANYNYDTNSSTVKIANGGDANGDGKIDTKDLVLIRRYLANYNYDTGSSTIVLGP